MNYSPNTASENTGITRGFSDADKSVLRELAKRYNEVAAKPLMAERKAAWKDLRDLRPRRPMILFEPWSVEGFLSDYEFKCEDEIARNVETKLVYDIRQFETLGDDIVIEPVLRLGWQGHDFKSTGSDYGPIKIIEDHLEGSMAYKSEFPVQGLEDVRRMEKREFHVDRTRVLAAKTALDEAFDGLMEIRVGNYDNFNPALGNQPFTGLFYTGITMDVFKLIGFDNMMLWPYDEPETLAELIRFLVDDKKRFFKYLEDEHLIYSNTEGSFIGPSSYGWTDTLPQPKSGDSKISDLWTWTDSQETQAMGPELFDEFYLPAMAELANMFGAAYYGCCERIDHKFEAITKRIPNVRTFSCSGWTNIEAAAEKMGSKYVMSKKPYPAFVSDTNADWEAVKKDAAQTAAAARRNGTPIEVIFRDYYTANVSPKRIAELIRIWKEALDIV
jgi:hypothetical protein